MLGLQIMVVREFTFDTLDKWQAQCQNAELNGGVARWTPAHFGTNNSDGTVTDHWIAIYDIANIESEMVFCKCAEVYESWDKLHEVRGNDWYNHPVVQQN